MRKAVSDMARCKECIHGECCSVFIPIRTTLCNDNADKMCKLFKPTADVVPRSEVDSIITEIADFIWQGESEKMNFPFNNHYYNKQEFIAELKKKYI